MAPVYRPGDRVVVAPGDSPRRGDRVVVRTRSGEVMAKELASLKSSHIILRSFNPQFEDRRLDVAEIAWMARIVWASQ